MGLAALLADAQGKSQSSSSSSGGALGKLLANTNASSAPQPITAPLLQSPNAAAPDFSKLQMKPIFHMNPVMDDKAQGAAFMSTIPQQFSAGVEQAGQGMYDMSQGKPGLLSTLGGIGSAFFSPLAPTNVPINMAVNAYTDKFTNDKDIQSFANQLPFTDEQIAAGAKNASDVSNAAGLFSAVGGLAKGMIKPVEDAKVQAATDVKAPEPHLNEYAGPMVQTPSTEPATLSTETTPIPYQSTIARFKPETPPPPKLLTAPKGPNPIQGEGFTMTDKPNPAKIAAGRLNNTYQKAVTEFNQNPTPKTLAIVQDARAAKAPTIEPPKNEPLIPKPVTQETSVKSETPIEPKTVTPNKTGTVTKAASDINETLVKQGFDALPPEEQSKFKSGSYKDDIAATHDLMNTDIESAKAMATGETPVKGIRYPQILFNTIEALATKEGDGALLSKLAASPLGKKLSEAGGTLGSHGFNDNPNSAVKAIQDIKAARTDAVTKKYGDYQKASKTITDQIKFEIKKAAPSKQDWSSFIDSIQC